MKKIILVAGLVLLFSCQHAFAYQTALIGGVRDGLGMGIETSNKFSDYVTGRFGVEGTTGEDQDLTGDNPFLVFVGLKMPLAASQDSPVSWGLGLIGNYGNRTELGEYISVIFDKFYRDAYFLETGLDWFGDHGHLEAQVGYRFPSWNQ